MPRSGISYAPEVEWRLAAAWANYTWEAFCELGGEQMSAHIAAYRLDKQIDGVLAAEQTRRARRASRQPRESGETHE